MVPPFPPPLPGAVVAVEVAEEVVDDGDMVGIVDMVVVLAIARLLAKGAVATLFGLCGTVAKTQ